MATTSATIDIQPSATPNPWLGVWTLAQRELVRFFRQRNRVVGALGQPILFWVLFGFGFESSFRMRGVNGEEINYLQYYFPGTLSLILLFTAIFTTMSIIEDRREGFLQSVLVSPLPRWAMVLGKVMGGALIAVGVGTVFLLLGLTIDVPYSLLQLISVIGFTWLVAFGLTALGFIFAWRLDSTQGYHAIMSVVLFPMWLLSGAFFPAEEGLLGWLVRVNPFSYAVAGIRHLLYWQPTAETSTVGSLPSFGVCFAVTLAFAGICFLFACTSASRTTKGDLLS